MYKGKFTEEFKSDLIADYENGMSLKELKAKNKTGSDTIYKIIDGAGIPRRNSKDLSKFYNLEDPELQYWLGYICADGNIEYKESYRVYKVSLFSVDEEVMDKFSKYFGPIVKRYNRKDSNVMECSIHSKVLCEYFINTLNITPNKGLDLNPNIEYTRNFLLGYFDGDGSIANSAEERVRYEAKITSGSIDFIDKVDQILNKEGIYTVIRSKGNAFDLCIERKAESEKFYRFLYRDMVTCLSRKLNNFVALYGNI